MNLLLSIMGITSLLPEWSFSKGEHLALGVFTFIKDSTHIRNIDDHKKKPCLGRWKLNQC